MRTNRIDEIRNRLKELPDVRAHGDDDRSSTDTMGIAAEFTKTLRKLGVQQTRADTTLMESINEATSRIDDVHQAALDARDRAVQAERQAENLAEVLIEHLDLLERAIGVMEEAGGLEKWVGTLRKGANGTLAAAAKWGLVSVGLPGEPFDPSVHDSTNQIERTDETVVVRATARRGYLLNGRVVRRAEVEIGIAREG